MPVMWEHPRLGRPAGSALVLAAALALGACQATVNKINPMADTVDTFDGRFIDTVAEDSATPSDKASDDEVANFSTASGGDTAAGSSHPSAGPEINPELQGLINYRMYGNGVVDVPELEAHARKILDRLLDGWPGPRPKLTLYVSPDPTYNAKAFLDDTVVVHLGLLLKLLSEDELAALLGHEVSHILLRHAESDTAGLARRRLHGAVGYVGGLMAQHGDKLGKAGKTAKKVGRYNRLSDLVFSNVLGPAWTREQEDEADLLMVDLLAKAGYSFRGFERFFTTLDEIEKEQAAAKAAATPKASDIMVEDKAQQGDAQGVQIWSLMGQVEEKVSASLWEAFSSDDHASAEERLAALHTYVDREYADSPLKDASVDRIGLFKLKKDKSTAKALKRLEQSQDAIKLLAVDVKKANDLAYEAIKGDGSDSAYARYVLYQARLERGDERSARRNLELAFENPSPDFVTMDLLQAHVMTLVDDGQADRAAVVLDNAMAGLGDLDTLLPLRLRVMHALNRSDEVSVLLSRCQLSGNQELLEVCMDAAGNPPASKQSALPLIK
ncbi:MAG: M48 family metalloprotease [Rhodobacterales bacterium]|nr:M48 family metalloprotease [Rhodobacterales bacterium]